MPALLLKKPLCTGDLSWHATATAKNYVFIGYKLKILFSGGGEGGVTFGGKVIKIWWEVYWGDFSRL